MCKTHKNSTCICVYFCYTARPKSLVRIISEKVVTHKKGMEQTDIASIQTLVSRDVFVIRQANLNDLPALVAQRRHMYEDMGYTDTARLDELEKAFELWLHDKLEDGHYRT